uniref:Uncharacterized protein n=1 Tax=Glossina austeni TaxID=7395 RepID=A0A1A9VMZ2_GLOAU
MIILDNHHQAANSRDIFDITLYLSLWTLLCMIVLILGIKIWWFKHRSSNEQVANENESTVEGGTYVTAPSVLPRRRKTWIFSKDKRYSQQISQSPAEIQGIFRIRQDETFAIQSSPTELLPTHARKLSRSAPSLFPQEQISPCPLSKGIKYDSASASTSRTSEKPTQGAFLICEELNRPLTQPKVLEPSSEIEPCNRNEERINNNEVVVARQENGNSYIKCEEIDSQVKYIHDLQMLNDLKNCKENLSAKAQGKICTMTSDSASNALETRPFQEGPILENDERPESTKAPTDGCPANFQRNQLNADLDLLKECHSFRDSGRLENKSHDFYDSVATNEEKISNPSLKFADKRKSLEMNVKCVDDLKERSPSNFIWPTQFRAKHVHKMIAKRLSKCSLINLNKTKINCQLDASNKKGLEYHVQKDFTENSTLSNTSLFNTVMSVSDENKGVSHSIRYQEPCSKPKHPANPFWIGCEQHRKRIDHEGDAEMFQNTPLGSSRSTTRHVTFVNPSDFSDENNSANSACNVAIKARRPTGYELSDRDTRDLTEFATFNNLLTIPGNSHQLYDYCSSPHTDSIGNIERNFLEIADSEDFLNFESEKKSLSGLISKHAGYGGCSDMENSKQMKKSKEQHVAFNVFEEFEINQKSRNSAISKRRPTDLQEEENLHYLRGAFELDDNISFDSFQNSSDSKSLGLKDFNIYENLPHDDYQLSQKSLLQHTPIHDYQDKKQSSARLGSASCKASEKINYTKHDSNSLISNRDNNDYDDRHSWVQFGENIHEEFVKNIEEEFSKIRHSYVHSENNCPDIETISQMQQPASYGKARDEEDSDSFGKLQQQLDCLRKSLKGLKKETKDFRPSIRKEFHISDGTSDKNKLRKSRVTFDMNDDEYDVLQEKPDQPDDQASIKTGLRQTRLSSIKLNYNEEAEDSWSAIRKYRNLTEELRSNDAEDRNEHMNEDKTASVDTSRESSYRNPLAQLKRDQSYNDDLEAENLQLNSIKSPITAPRDARDYRREIINLEARHNANESSEA